MLRKTRTENGEVCGVVGTNARITVYKGIPYAAPPVGKNSHQRTGMGSGCVIPLAPCASRIHREKILMLFTARNGTWIPRSPIQRMVCT